MIKDNIDYNKQAKPNTDLLGRLYQNFPEYFEITNDAAHRALEPGNTPPTTPWSGLTFDRDKFIADLRARNVNELSQGNQLAFIGKDYAKAQAGERTITVVTPDTIHNNDAHNRASQNLFFSGDNLEVLRQLRGAYRNSVDAIYIDPPYNTGSADDFIYPDKFEYSDNELQTRFGMTDDEVKRFHLLNGSRTHSAWLTFMYPRLSLAKKLLKDTGVIFVSIDDNEQANLKLLMDEIFGSESFVGCASRKTRGSATTKGNAELQKINDYLLIYIKNKNIAKLDKLIVGQKTYPLHDERGDFYIVPLQDNGPHGTREARPNLWYPIYQLNDGSLTYDEPSEYKKRLLPKKHQNKEGRWMWSKAKFDSDNRDLYVKDDVVYIKHYHKDDEDQNRYQYQKLWIDNCQNAKGTKRLNELFGDQRGLFTNPKPVELIRYCLDIAVRSNPNATIMDFFAGSGTTADAVMQLNAEDGGQRRFILCTLPEPTYHRNSDGSETPTNGGAEAYRAGYRTIDQLSMERIRRAEAKILDDYKSTHNGELPANWQGGFKHYYVTKPTQPTLDTIDNYNFDANPQLLDASLFNDMITPFSASSLSDEYNQLHGNASGSETIMQTMLLADGYQLTEPVEQLDLDGYTAYYLSNRQIYLIDGGWTATQSKQLLNLIGTHQLQVSSVELWGYSFGVASINELLSGLKPLKIALNKRY